MVGCFLPWEAHINAGPNARRYIERPPEHAKSMHEKKAKAATKKALLKGPAPAMTLSNPLNTAVDKKQQVLKVKYGKSLKCRDIRASVEEKKMDIGEK